MLYIYEMRFNEKFFHISHHKQFFINLCLSTNTIGTNPLPRRIKPKGSNKNFLHSEKDFFFQKWY